MKKIIIYLFTVLTIYSCTPNDSDSDSNSNSNKNYLKSHFDDSGFPATFYEYENGFLTKSYNGNFVTTYQYDNIGRLQLRTVESQSYSYEYDNQNRLIKEIKNGTNDYISLSYLTNKIIATNYSSTNGTNLVSDIYIDNSGRIIKTVQMTSTYSSEYLTQEFTYDINGNVINRSYSDNVDNQPNISINFQYDNKINPFYNANKKLFNSIYYLEGRKEFPIDIVNPNNIISVETSTSSSIRNITYNTDNLPSKISISVYQNGSSQPTTSVSFYEYY